MVLPCSYRDHAGPGGLWNRSTSRGSCLGRGAASPTRQPLTDDVHDVLVDMLMNHTLGPGGRLNIDAVAKMLGVSPTPVREALARLEAEGLIVKEPRRGYLVAPLISLDDLHSLIDFRLLVEPAAAAAAAAAGDTRAGRRPAGAGTQWWERRQR